MIKVVAHNFVRDGCLSEFLAVVKTLVEETNSLDPGCLSYAMYQDLSDPLRVTCIEEWASEETMNSHLKSAHFRKSVEDLLPYCAKPTEASLYKKLF
ncbi:Quinol monooxygenase YgiN [Sporobacter termitidis DSM 10068]|uniref:Quinol monooxygenase YgiN n=1 Tax=Sporobacter termitidis DSM 10068 TaxID=1123282 RepID=A0A1M5ZH73_9FIRM|nr:putative quinol monooxygenase [Sporobacter termitidis]SHI23499.1 Quinol monooxygenase YgiN [Sporobacter termitidis DSM 10068]